MITSIVVTGCHEIKMSSTRKIKIGDNVLSVDKDIPFIRYRLDTYDENEFNYINKMKEQFKSSTHLVEIKLSDKTASILEKLQDMNVAKYVYMDITDTEVFNEKLSDEVSNLLATISGLHVDRYMLKDKSTTLDSLTYRKIVQSISNRFGIDTSDIGVCSSPLSFNGSACLTAVKARELMTTYSTIADVALPSANHQCMNSCGCIRYMIVDSNLEAPVDKKEKGTVSKSSSDKSGGSKPKVKSKQPVVCPTFI